MFAPALCPVFSTRVQRCLPLLLPVRGSRAAVLRAEAFFSWVTWKYPETFRTNERIVFINCLTPLVRNWFPVILGCFGFWNRFPVIGNNNLEITCFSTFRISKVVLNLFMLIPQPFLVDQDFLGLVQFFSVGFRRCPVFLKTHGWFRCCCKYVDWIGWLRFDWKETCGF